MHRPFPSTFISRISGVLRLESWRKWAMDCPNISISGMNKQQNNSEIKDQNNFRSLNTKGIKDGTLNTHMIKEQWSINQNMKYQVM